MTDLSRQLFGKQRQAEAAAAAASAAAGQRVAQARAAEASVEEKVTHYACSNSELERIFSNKLILGACPPLTGTTNFF